MRRFFYILISILSLSCTNKETSKDRSSTEKEVANDVFFKADNKAFVYSGRTYLKDSLSRLISSASKVEFLAEGESIEIRLSTDAHSPSYITITIDDEINQRTKIKKGELNRIIVNLNASKKQKIGIHKTTEALMGDIVFHGVETTAIFPVEEDSQAVFIEFIGDSITCGAASDSSEMPCDEGEYSDHDNGYLAYGPRTARNLDAKYTVSSVSGIGIYRNWNEEFEDAPIMPKVYENLSLTTDASISYDFKKQPNIVTICLGTNDLSKGDGKKERLPFSKENYIENYKAFVTTVIGHYPNATIALLNSPMINNEEKLLIKNCLQDVQDYFKEQNKVLHYFEFSKMYTSGCSYHPSVADHKLMSEELIPFIKGLLAQ